MRLVHAAMIMLVLAVPASAVGIDNPDTSTPTTLYFHLIDGRNDFPINTQVPSDDWSLNANRGLMTHSTSCLPDSAAGPLASKEWHTWYGYSSPSLVQYDVTQDGLPRVHPERGFSYDVVLDTSVQPVFHWYLVPSAGTTAVDARSLIVPNVVVQATIRTGSAIGIGEEHYNTGEVLASGRSEPAVLAGEATQGATYHADTGAYGMAVPLDLQRDRIPSATGFNVRIDVWMDNPACGGGSDGYLMGNTVGLHTAPDQRPRIDLATMNPLSLDAIHPQFVGDDLVVHILANSPWGSYDVDEQDGFTFDIQGPSRPKEVSVHVTDHIHDHGATSHFQPLAIAIVWPYVQEGALPGEYTFDFRIGNDQETAEAVGSAMFEVGRDGGGTTCYEMDGARVCDGTEPGTQNNNTPGIAMAVLLVGMVAICMRFRP